MIHMENPVKPLPIPLPPDWEIVVGWTSTEARWLALCWESCGDNPWIEDGRLSMTGRAWAYLAWARHPAVAPHLAGCDIGGSDRDGTERLLIDRTGRSVYVAPVAEARWFVRGQWPVQEPSRLSPEELDKIVDHV